MNLLSRIWFPFAVLSLATVGPLDLVSTRGTVAEKEPGAYSVASSEGGSGSRALEAEVGLESAVTSPTSAPDTIIYPIGGYRRLVVRDTSGRAIIDSLLEPEIPDTIEHVMSPKDSLKAQLDSSLWDKLDSIYTADSAAKAKAKFDAWYAGLDKAERKKYDAEQKAKARLARADSLAKVAEEKQNIKDSLLEVTPRILETYALPDSLQHKRIVAWTLDTDFQNLKTYIPDSSYNYHFYDYPFQRKDVNATWLGVAGSAVQYYDYFKRKSDERVEFYKVQEPWSYSPRTLPHYNTKTPYTELAYWGTLFAGQVKESHNVHILTTQNITPELNVTLLYDLFSGEGMLQNEKSITKNGIVQANYLGKKYMMHVGYIYNGITHQENGGILDNMWVRDTTVDAREIGVTLTNAKTRSKKHSVFLDQQFRIPFSFISRLKARRDSTFVFNADSLDRDITTAYIGHSSEFTTYSRRYIDAINTQEGRDFYNGVFLYNPSSSKDSMRVAKLDNKFYIRLQPWSADGPVSKLDVGLGDEIKTYYDSTYTRPLKHTENAFYLYAGVEGQIKKNFFWDARAKYVFSGPELGDFNVEANGTVRLYPFRRARKSPLELGVHFETSLLEPTYYEKHISANHFKWDHDDFSKTSTTKIQGYLSIPHWQFYADVGYALLSNNLFYDTSGLIQQNGSAMSILTVNLRKNFKFGPLHLDNRGLFQISSKSDVVPLPLLALDCRWYLEFVVARNAEKTKNVMSMQAGIDVRYNTPWHSPAWNPNLGVFHNQELRRYNNGPVFDVFVNVQWKRACIFVKYQNAGGGWPAKKRDYFSADRYITTQNGITGLKIGIFWPFYIQPAGRPPKDKK